MLPRTKDRAFSLVEFVIAVGVLTFGLAAIYNQFLEIRIPSQQRLLMAQARGVAHQRLEELRAAPHDALKNYAAPGKFSRVEVQPRFLLRESLSEAAGGAIEIAVEVGWDPIDETEQTFPDGKLLTVKGLRTP